MAFVSYVLFVALLKGLQEDFHPEILGTAGSKALAVVILDFLFVKTGCYILNIQGSSQILDLLAYCGYKFVGFVLSQSCLISYPDPTVISSVIMTLVASFLQFNRTIYTIVFFYFFLANAFFLVSSSFRLSRLYFSSFTASISSLCRVAGHDPGQRWNHQPSTKEPPDHIPLPGRHDPDPIHVDPRSNLITGKTLTALMNILYYGLLSQKMMAMVLHRIRDK